MSGAAPEKSFQDLENENRQLVETILELRARYESAQQEAQLALTRPSAELVACERASGQLRETIGELRQQMDSELARMAARHEAGIRQQEGERAELRRTIELLRAELENQQDRSAAALRDAERAAGAQIRQLQRTISALRGQLERTHGPT
jgi:molybdopterin converting factor small subunit